MMRLFKIASLSLLALLVIAFGLGGKGYLDAVRASDHLSTRADTLIAKGLGGGDLGDARLEQLLRVQDPAFYSHAGVDFRTAGAGATTISQSLSKRLAFKRFRPGIGKIRQTGYALGLERHLNKDQILALWLETVEMGQGSDGWMTGFFTASEAVFEAAPPELSDKEYISLLAVLIAPGSYNLQDGGENLSERIHRIERLLAGSCTPLDHGEDFCVTRLALQFG